VEKHWTCPNCDSWAITRDGKIPMHPCRSGGQLAGMMVPLIMDGVKAKVEAIERPDYVGNELVQMNAYGRPIMSVITTRDDGQDCTVYAPCAVAERE
jgi:hypothetical protein